MKRIKESSSRMEGRHGFYLISFIWNSGSNTELMVCLWRIYWRIGLFLYCLLQICHSFGVISLSKLLHSVDFVFLLFSIGS